MENIVKQRLMEFISFKRISVNKFEQLCGISPSYVRNIRKSISFAVLDKIKSVYPELNEDWLIDGVGNMIIELQQEVPQSPQVYTTYLVPLSATGGVLADFGEEGVMAHQCERISVPIPADIAIRVDGDSMEPEFPNGSIVLANKIDPTLFIEWGAVFVIDSPNGRVIKEVRRSELPDRIKCVSRNRTERYEPFDIAFTAIRAMYKVLGVFACK